MVSVSDNFEFLDHKPCEFGMGYWWECHRDQPSSFGVSFGFKPFLLRASVASRSDGWAG